MYPPTTSESSVGDSSFESSAGASRKRCRSPAATDINTDVLADIEADVTAIKVAVDRDVEAGVDAGIGMEVNVRVDVEYEVEDEVESSDRGTMEDGVDVVARIDIPDGMLMPDAVEHLEQRELEARSLIVGGERDSLLKQVASLERSNVTLRGTVMMESARADRSYTAGSNEKKGYAGPLPYCNKSTQRALVVNQRVPTCFECGRQGHYKNECPKLKNQTRGNKAGKKTDEARGKAYVLGGGEANPDSNAVTGTFLLNNHYASMLFDSGADRSFVSSTFSALLDVTPSTLDVSFDVIIGMDWLANQHAVIICDEKIVRIPYGDEVLIIQVTKKEIKDKSEEKRLEDVPIMLDFSEVFPEDMTGLPPTRLVEFQIDLVPSAALVA
ncbi:putative reverse transcriptase domain-containing protein [Tanacetum coccineum]